LLLDVATVRTSQSSDGHVGIEDPHIASLPDEGLDQRDDGAFAEIVRSGFEREADYSNLPFPRREHRIYRSANLLLVRRENRGEQRNREVGSACSVSQGAQILGQAGAAEGEARTQICLGDVQFSIHQEDPHGLLRVDPERCARVGDLIREAYLERVECVGDILDHFRRRHIRVDEGGLDVPIERADRRGRLRVGAPDEGQRRMLEVTDGSPLAQELRGHGDPHGGSQLAARARADGGQEHPFAGSGQHGASQYHGVGLLPRTQPTSDTLSDALQGVHSEPPVRFPWGADTNQPDGGVPQRVGRRNGGPPQSCAMVAPPSAWGVEMVARKRPAATTSEMSALKPGSTTGEALSLIMATFSSSMSTPITSWPAFARQAAVTDPT